MSEFQNPTCLCQGATLAKASLALRMMEYQESTPLAAGWPGLTALGKARKSWRVTWACHPTAERPARPARAARRQPAEG